MRALVIPCLWAVAIMLLAVAITVAIGQSTASQLDSPLGVLIYAPVAEDVRCAACDGDAATLSRLLAEHPDMVNARDADGWTALHEAARIGGTRVIGVLLENGADVNAANNEGDTPLHAAARAGEPAAAGLLAAADADINARNHQGQTPLDLAMGHGWTRLAEMLRQEGGRPGSAVR